MAQATKFSKLLVKLGLATDVGLTVQAASTSQSADLLQLKNSAGTVIYEIGPLALGATRVASVTLTNAQIKALRATPITLVAAPGAGYMVEFVAAVLLLKAGANVLTESTANLAVKYTDGSGVQVSQTIETTGFIDQAADTLTSGEAKIDAIVAKTGCDNKALVLHNLGAGEYAGNAAADATMKVRVLYRIHSTT